MHDSDTAPASPLHRWILQLLARYSLLIWSQLLYLPGKIPAQVERETLR